MNIKEYIEGELGFARGKAIGLDIGGPGSEAFRDFTAGFFVQSAGVSLYDYRLGSDKEIDSVHNHDVIEGNVFEPEIRQKVYEWLDGRKVNLIIERMVGGLRFIPQDLRTLSKILRLGYQLLDPQGGIMLIEVPLKIRDPEMAATKAGYPQIEPKTLKDKTFYPRVLRQWVEMINREHHENLEVVWDGAAALRLVRRPGAPQELPMLDIRKLRSP